MTNNNPKMDLFPLKKRGVVEEKISDSFHIFKELYDQPIAAEENKEIQNNFTNIPAKSYMLKNFEHLELLRKDISIKEMTVDLNMVERRGHTPYLQQEEKYIGWDHTTILQEEKDIWGSYTNSSNSRSALQPHPSASPRNFRSFRASTLRTDHPPSSLSSSSSSSFTHSKTRRASPTQETHHHLRSYGLSSKIASSHSHPKQSYTSCSQSSTTQIRPKQGINPRSDDALDLFIPAKLNILVSGDEKQVSSRLEQYSSGIEEKEQTFRVVGKNWGDYRSCKEAEDLEVRWIKHYSSAHKILLVGEGDFSFSASLAVAFDSAANITATSLDSREFLSKNYSRALSNIDKLQSLAAVVMHNVDATNMANISQLKFKLFDRLVYNFPHAGFFDEKREDKICRHRKLVQLFLENAKRMIYIDGEIHITHKSNNGFYKDWGLEFIASKVGLQLIEEVPFDFRDYPGYRTKYGFGGDKNFNSNPSKTYKFGHKNLYPNPRYRFYGKMPTHSGMGTNQGHEISIYSDKNISKSSRKKLFQSYDNKSLTKITKSLKGQIPL